MGRERRVERIERGRQQVRDVERSMVEEGGRETGRETAGGSCREKHGGGERLIRGKCGEGWLEGKKLMREKFFFRLCAS